MSDRHRRREHDARREPASRSRSDDVIASSTIAGMYAGAGQFGSTRWRSAL